MLNYDTCAELDFCTYSPKNKFAYNVPWDIPISAVWYFNQRLLNLNQTFCLWFRLYIFCHVCLWATLSAVINKMYDSSIIIEGIKTVLFFFYEKISQAQTAKKKQAFTKTFIIRTKSTKSTNRKKSGLSLKCLLYGQKAQIAKKKMRTFTKMFIIRTKAIKSTNRKKSFLRCIAHKKYCFICYFADFEQVKISLVILFTLN